MGLLRTVAAWAGRTAYGRAAVASRADLSLFKQRPSFLFIVGLILLGLSYVIGWPGVLASGIAAAYLKSPWIFVIGGPAIYAFSFLVWGISMLLMGKDNIKYAQALAKYGVRIFIEKFAPQSYRENNPSSRSSGSASSKSNDSE